MEVDMKALVYGSILWDVYPDARVIGGDSFNFSAHLALLGNEVGFISAVGNDELGNDTLREIEHYSVLADFVERSDKDTGKVMVALDENGVPTFDLLTDTAYDNITACDEDIAKMREFGAELFYFNTLSQRGEVSRETLKKILGSMDFSEIVCDLNIRTNCYDRESIEFCLSSATVVKISDEEAHFVFDEGILEVGEELSEGLRKKFPNIRLLVYTMGGEGSRIFSLADGKTYESGKPRKVKIASTVGAGDCYLATFVNAHLRGRGIEAAISEATERCLAVVANTAAIPEEFVKFAKGEEK